METIRTKSDDELRAEVIAAGALDEIHALEARLDRDDLGDRAAYRHALEALATAHGIERRVPVAHPHKPAPPYGPAPATREPIATTFAVIRTTENHDASPAVLGTFRGGAKTRAGAERILAAHDDKAGLEIVELRGGIRLRVGCDDVQRCFLANPPSATREPIATVNRGRFVYAVTRGDEPVQYEVQPPRDNTWRAFRTLDEAVLFARTGLSLDEVGEAIARATMSEGHDPVVWFDRRRCVVAHGSIHSPMPESCIVLVDVEGVRYYRELLEEHGDGSLATARDLMEEQLRCAPIDWPEPLDEVK